MPPLSFAASKKGTDKDLAYFVREAGDILGVTDKIPRCECFLNQSLHAMNAVVRSADRKDDKDDKDRQAKRILEYIMRKVVDFKKLVRACDMLLVAALRSLHENA